MQNNFNVKTIISTFFIVILCFTLIGVVGKVLTPFLIALILAYILNPLVEILSKKLKMHRNFSSLIISLLVFLIFIAIPLFLLPTLVEQFRGIIDKTPSLISSFNDNVLLNINDKYHTQLHLDFDSVRQTIVSKLSDYKNTDIFAPIAKNSVILIEIIVYIILIPFVLFYTLKNWHEMLQFFDNLIPRGYLKKTHEIIHDIDTMMSAYLRGQISVMLIMAIYYGIGLFLTNLTSGLIIGVMTGLLVFIPYIGISIGLLLSLCISLAGDGSGHQIIWILVVFVIGHILEGGLVTPFLVGGKIGLNPVMVILALMIFGKAFGIVGVLLALPLATITVVILKYMRIYYMNSSYYKH